MATGSGAKESEAHKDNVKPSATWAGTFSLISLNLLKAVFVSSLITNKGSFGCLGLLSHEEVQMPKRQLIRVILKEVIVRISSELVLKNLKYKGINSILK
jgi:hypothetical protein